MPEPHRLIFNKDQLRNEGKQHTNHLMSANSFPGPEKGGGKKTLSSFLLGRPNMAKHQGNSEWNQLHLLLSFLYSYITKPGYSAANNYNEELLTNGFQIAPRWGIN